MAKLKPYHIYRIPSSIGTPLSRRVARVIYYDSKLYLINILDSEKTPGDYDILLSRISGNNMSRAIEVDKSNLSQLETSLIESLRKKSKTVEARLSIEFSDWTKH